MNRSRLADELDHKRWKSAHRDDHSQQEPIQNTIPGPIHRNMMMRELGISSNGQKQRMETNTMDYISRSNPQHLREKEFDIGESNKIFASHWLNHRQVVFGTKCNKLVVIDMLSKNMTNIPIIKSSEKSKPAECPCGIHAIDINPSGTVLATGASNTNDLAFYKLPTFDHICTGEEAHSDWVFDIKFIDDEYLASGSRDGTVAIWRVKDEEIPSSISMDSIGMSQEVKKAVYVKPCKGEERVRAISVNKKSLEIGALTLDAHVYLWDVSTMKQKFKCRLAHPRENVCMCLWPDHDSYAVGSQSHVTMLDPRCKKATSHINSKQPHCGIRSVNFNGNILSYGSGAGQIFFYDVRAKSYIDMSCGHSCSLKVSKGWLLHDETFRDHFSDNEYPNAIYTHTYDETGSKLFVGGGPLPAGLWGNYAGLWL